MSVSGKIVMRARAVRVKEWSRLMYVLASIMRARAVRVKEWARLMYVLASTNARVRAHPTTFEARSE